MEFFSFEVNVSVIFRQADSMHICVSKFIITPYPLMQYYKKMKPKQQEFKTHAIQATPSKDEYNDFRRIVPNATAKRNQSQGQSSFSAMCIVGSIVTDKF